jgi:hypothetical protein
LGPGWGGLGPIQQSLVPLRCTQSYDGMQMACTQSAQPAEAQQVSRIASSYAMQYSICFMSRPHHGGGFDVAGIQVMLLLAHDDSRAA